MVTDEEIIEGLSFVAYHRVATSIFVPAPFGSAVEMVPIDPSDLEAAQARDVLVDEMQPVDQVAAVAECYLETKAGSGNTLDSEAVALK